MAYLAALVELPGAGIFSGMSRRAPVVRMSSGVVFALMGVGLLGEYAFREGSRWPLFEGLLFLVLGSFNAVTSYRVWRADRSQRQRDESST